MNTKTRAKNDVFGTQANDIFFNHTDNSNICLRIPPFKKIDFLSATFEKRLPVGCNLSGESVCMIMITLVGHFEPSTIIW